MHISIIVRDAEGICGRMLKKAFLVSKSRDLCAINDILVLDISYPLRPQCFTFTSVRPRVHVSVTLRRFIPIIAPKGPTALVLGAPEPRIYLRSG